jgi:type VI secretion system secreted protein Hcp
MAQDMFLKLDGITGESLDDKHPSEIQVTSWSFGLSNSGSAGFGSGSGSGKVDFQDIVLTKPVDLSTPILWQWCCNGKHCPSGTLTVRKAGTTPLEYLVFSFTNIVVSHASTAGSGGDDVQFETIGLHFQSYKMVYTKQDEAGAAAGTAEGGWDVAKNVVVS